MSRWRKWRFSFWRRDWKGNFKRSHIWNIYRIFIFHSILMHFFLLCWNLSEICQNISPISYGFQDQLRRNGTNSQNNVVKSMPSNPCCVILNGKLYYIILYCNYNLFCKLFFLMSFLVCCYKYDVFYMLMPSVGTWLTNEYLV